MPKRTKFEREQHLAIIAKGLARGLTYVQVAEQLGNVITPRMVCKEVKLLLKRLHKEQLEKAGLARAKEALRLEHVIAESFEAWERSKLDAVTIERKLVGEEGEPGIVVTEKRTGQAGDSRHILAVIKAIEAKSKLLGLAMPLVVESKRTVQHTHQVLIQAALKDDRARHALDAIAVGVSGQGWESGLIGDDGLERPLEDGEASQLCEPAALGCVGAENQAADAHDAPAARQE